MEDKSIFQDKTLMPDETDLASGLGSTYELWVQLCNYVMERYPQGNKEWSYPGSKYGWNFRIKDKKRAIVYLLPRDQYFKAAFVFGQKGTDAVMASGVAEEIKTMLQEARVYAEGRGIRIDVTDDTLMPDLKTLTDIKLAN